MAATGAGRRGIRIIVDPVLPGEITALPRDNALVLARTRNGWKPLPEPRRSLAAMGAVTVRGLFAALFLGAGLPVETVLAVPEAGRPADEADRLERAPQVGTGGLRASGRDSVWFVACRHGR
ncbi:hypothetical protein [Streptosporangium saharense]|uniref:hypothetical protein n=1 Tax=Streptosporangium saharense TaxID=1706840 RepID=UPI00343BF620